jgi:hypothetical protein
MCEQIIDNEYLLLFDYESPSTPHYMMYNKTNYFNVKDYLSLTNGNKGFTAAVYVNLYYGVDYLNELFYPMPNLMCTKPITFAANKIKNAEACGTKFSSNLITKNKRRAKDKYCYDTPLAPQQDYQKCTLNEFDCANAALASAQALVALVTGIAVIGLVLISRKVLSVPVSDDELLVQAALIDEAEGNPGFCDKFRGPPPVPLKTQISRKLGCGDCEKKPAKEAKIGVYDEAALSAAVVEVVEEPTVVKVIEEPIAEKKTFRVKVPVGAPGTEIEVLAPDGQKIKLNIPINAPVGAQMDVTY